MAPALQGEIAGEHAQPREQRLRHLDRPDQRAAGIARARGKDHQRGHQYQQEQGGRAFGAPQGLQKGCKHGAGCGRGRLASAGRPRWRHQA